jgi:hypothetical protein
MTVKTVAGVAFAAACFMSWAAIPGANAQTAPSSSGPQSYQGNAYPNSTAGSSGATTGNYAPQNYQGGSSPTGYAGTDRSTGGNYSPQPPAADMGNTEVMTNGPQGSPPPDWSARRNVIASEHYDRLLESNRGFRQARMRKECGPITDPQLHQQCLDSFAQYEPAGAATGYGSSTSARHHYRSNAGR